MAEPVTERGRQSRQLIIDTAAELVAAEGIERTTLGDIAARNRQTTGTIYRYFDGKHSLLVTVFEDYIAQLISAVRRPAKRGDLTELARAWMDVSANNVGAVRVREELLATDPDFVELWTTYRPVLQRYIDQAIGSRFSDRPAFTSDLIFDALEQQTRGVAMGWQTCGTTRFAAALSDVVAHGLYLPSRAESGWTPPSLADLRTIYQPALEWTPASDKRAPSSERGTRTLAKIQQAAEKLFADQGITKTTIRDIADEAGISSGTAYQYFQDKEEVFISLAADAERAIVEDTFLPMAALDVAGAYLHYLDVYRKHAGTFRAWWGFTDANAAPAQAWSSVRSHLLDQFENVFIICQSLGVARSDADPRAAGEVYADLHERIAYRRLVTGGLDVADDAIATFLEQLFKRPH